MSIDITNENYLSFSLNGKQLLIHIVYIVTCLLSESTHKEHI